METKKEQPFNGMKWEKTSSTSWEARGQNGTFYLKANCGGWRGEYIPTNPYGKRFYLRWTKSIRELKNWCEENHYWEEPKHESPVDMATIRKPYSD